MYQICCPYLKEHKRFSFSSIDGRTTTHVPMSRSIKKSMAAREFFTCLFQWISSLQGIYESWQLCLWSLVDRYNVLTRNPIIWRPKLGAGSHDMTLIKYVFWTACLRVPSQKAILRLTEKNIDSFMPQQSK